MIQLVIDACPDGEWRLLVALSRFGGLLCPSKQLALRWPDIDWQRDRITVNSPKTEGNENQETRVMPLYLELEPYQRQALVEAPSGAEFVLSDRYRYGRTGLNLGTQFKRIILPVGGHQRTKYLPGLV